MATSISSIGVGSGLPLGDLLQQLRTAENAPLAALQSRANKEQDRFSAYGTLKSALDAVSSAAQALGKVETFDAVKTSVTGDTFTANARAGSGAIPGNHQVLVKQLASAQVMASGRADTANEAVAAGATGKVNITFTLKGDTTHTLAVDANASLQDIARAITADSDLKFSATLMNDGEGHRLIISSDETGEQNTITQIAVAAHEDGGSDFEALSNILTFDSDSGAPGEGTMGESVAGKNAIALINGIQVTSQKNTIEDAIEGVTLTLSKAAAEGASADSLNVTRDDAVATTAVTNFVNAYNALQSTIKSLTSYDVDAQQGAALTGDSLARRAQSQVRDAINGLAADGLTLSALGIKTDSTTGNLSVDTAKFKEVLSENRAAVQELFAGENGLTKRVESAVEVFTKSDGLIKTSQDGIERTLKLLEKQYEQTEARIDQKMETYRLQFVQLDSFMAQMNGISNYLTSQLSMLENLSPGKQKS